MKEHNTRSFLSGVLVALLAVGLIGTAAAISGKQQIEVDYSNIHVMLDGTVLTLKDAAGNEVEPFAYKGTTYLPVRAISNALGIDVRFFEGTNATPPGVILTSTSALNYFYQDTGVPRLDNIVGKNAYYDFLTEGVNQVRYIYSVSNFKNGTADSYQSLYQKLLENNGFKLYKTDEINGVTLYHYTNDATGIFMSLQQRDVDGAPHVFVMVNTEHKKTSDSSSTSSGSSTSSTSGSPAPSVPDDPYADNDYVIDVPNFNGKCPYCGLECFRDSYINDSVSVWYCRNPKCTHYEQRFQA